jgi:hypothetical protein
MLQGAGPAIAWARPSRSLKPRGAGLARGKQAAKSLNRLLSLKDQAHYGLFDVGGGDLKSALRQANGLIEFAEKTLRR